MPPKGPYCLRVVSCTVKVGARNCRCLEVAFEIVEGLHASVRFDQVFFATSFYPGALTVRALANALGGIGNASEVVRKAVAEGLTIVADLDWCAFDHDHYQNERPTRRGRAAWRQLQQEANVAGMDQFSGNPPWAIGPSEALVWARLAIVRFPRGRRPGPTADPRPRDQTVEPQTI